MCETEGPGFYRSMYGREFTLLKSVILERNGLPVFQ